MDTSLDPSNGIWAERQKTKGIEVVEFSLPLVECMKCKARWELALQPDGQWTSASSQCPNGCSSPEIDWSLSYGLEFLC